MTTEHITSEQVAEWMREQMAIMLDGFKYAQISVEVSALRATENPAVSFRIYVGQGYTTAVGSSIEECYELLAKQSPKSKAQIKRDEAAKLIAEAEKLENQTA